MKLTPEGLDEAMAALLDKWSTVPETDEARDSILGHLNALEAENVRPREALDEIERSVGYHRDSYGKTYCGWCGGYEGHEPDCPYRLASEALGKECP